jgi:hypothetical protein
MKSQDFNNNAVWIVNEFTEWLSKGVDSVDELYLNAKGDEKLRLLEKCNTMKMVLNKFEQLKNE